MFNAGGFGAALTAGLQQFNLARQQQQQEQQQAEQQRMQQQALARALARDRQQDVQWQVGQSRQLADTAAQSLAENPGQQVGEQLRQILHSGGREDMLAESGQFDTMGDPLMVARTTPQQKATQEFQRIQQGLQEQSLREANKRNEYQQVIEQFMRDQPLKFTDQERLARQYGQPLPEADSIETDRRANAAADRSLRNALAVAREQNQGRVDVAGITRTNRPVPQAERRVLQFGLRMKDALPAITELEDAVAQQSTLGQLQGSWAPNIMQSSLQQQYRQAQRAFTEARLRKDSGAAIPPHEYENDSKTYFFEPGDTPEVTEQKRRMRLGVMMATLGEAPRAYQEYFDQPFDAQAVAEEFGGRGASATAMITIPSGPHKGKQIPLGTVVPGKGRLTGVDAAGQPVFEP